MNGLRGDLRRGRAQRSLTSRLLGSRRRGCAQHPSIGWLVGNLRRGRAQRTLAAATALSALPLGLEIYFEHLRGSFGDKWMWTPVALSPLLSAAGLAGVRSRRAARTVLPALSALYCTDGLVGVYTHVQGVRKRPGGFSEPLYNIVMGPPLLAPGSLALVGGMGLTAALADRER
jgi:hypothetical protein